MATTIPATIGRIKEMIDAHFAARGFEWKTQESQGDHAQAKPTVFALICAERNAANWPDACPSVTIALQDVTAGRDTLQLNIVCHCAVVNSAIIEREKAVLLDDGIHYAYLEVDGYTEQGVREALFTDCLLLAEETMYALHTIAGVSNIKLIPPETLDDFPYCQCQVMATATALTQYIPDDLL